MFARIVCTMASAYWSCLIGVIEPRLLEDASQLLGTARFGGWKVCKDAFQLLVSAFVRSVECAVSLREGYKDAFQLLVSALVHWSDWRPSEKNRRCIQFTFL
jgi:hypothetical protein